MARCRRCGGFTADLMAYPDSFLSGDVPYLICWPCYVEVETGERPEGVA